MPGRLAGQLVDGGDPVSDEPVFVVDTGPADESNWSIVATDRSAADGSWSVTVPNTDPKRYHAVAEFEESGTLKNALSKPFLTSQPFAQANAVSVGFDVLSPAVSVGSAIPDSVVVQYLMDEGSGTTVGDNSGNDNNGTLSGAGWREDAQAVGGFTTIYDGIDDTGTVDNSGNLNFSELTVIITAILDDVDSRQAIISKGRIDNSSTSDDAEWGMSFQGQSNNVVRFHAQSNLSDSRIDADSTTAITSSGNRHQFVGRLDLQNDTISVGVDGTIEDTSAISELFETNEPIDWAFDRQAGDFYFDGEIGNIEIYGEALSDAQIQERYNSLPWS